MPKRKTQEPKGAASAARPKRQSVAARQPTRALSPFEDMEQMMERMLPRGWLPALRWDWPSMGELAAAFEKKMPRVDIIDRDADILVRAEVPGVSKDDLDVSVSENAVTIQGHMRKDKEEKGEYYRRETSYGAFYRTLPLPSDVDSDKAKATFKDGVLELTLPKAAKARRRTVQIQGG